MIGLIVCFWLSLAIIFYTYLGYGILLYVLVRIKRLFIQAKPDSDTTFMPEVTILIAAFNEADWIEEKINNCYALDYPEELIRFVCVTDGSTDATPSIVRSHPHVRLLHKAERAGKLAAVQGAMQLIESPIIVLTDANTSLNTDAIRHLAKHFVDPKVGMVAGEKRVRMEKSDSAESAGEGIYWKYESTLKKWDAELGTVVGAAGELFAIRRTSYHELPLDTIIEDFVQSMLVAKAGYKVVYEPLAYAEESASASVQEEWKRKVRIAAGAFQAMFRLKPLLNPFKYGVLSFQYFSHRVLRWTLAPLGLILVLVSNVLLAFKAGNIYQVFLVLQLLFYGAALLGFFLEKRQIRLKALFVPYYFCVMNLAVLAGFIRFLRGSQSSTWEKAERKA